MIDGSQKYKEESEVAKNSTTSSGQPALYTSKAFYQNKGKRVKKQIVFRESSINNPAGDPCLNFRARLDRLFYFCR